MSKKPLILGIESSCDETAASLLTENEQEHQLFYQILFRAKSMYTKNLVE